MNDLKSKTSRKTISFQTPRKESPRNGYNFNRKISIIRIGSRSKSRKKNNKNINKPFNGYGIFCEEKRDSFKKKRMSEPSINQLSCMWENFPSSEKEKYIEKHREILSRNRINQKNFTKIKTKISPDKLSLSSDKKLGHMIYTYNQEITEFINSCFKDRRPKTETKRKSTNEKTEKDNYNSFIISKRQSKFKTTKKKSLSKKLPRKSFLYLKKRCTCGRCQLCRILAFNPDQYK